MIQNHFAIPIYETYLDVLSTNIQDEIRTFIELNNNNFNPTWGDPVYTTFGSLTDVLDHIPALKYEIITNIQNFLQELSKEYISINMVRSWINITHSFGSQNYHIHNESGVSTMISGVYYFQTNGNDGNIVFKTDSDDIINNTLNIQKTVVFKPVIGKLILFPSFLRHKVTKNYTDTDRISIAFNCEIL